MLPIGPVGPGNSPYSSRSSFAGEPLFVSLEGLQSSGLIVKRDLTAARRVAGRSSSRTDYRRARAAKTPAFRAAFKEFRSAGGFDTHEYQAFERKSSHWLPGWQKFMGDRSGFHAFLQFEFDSQWASLRARCAKKTVRLLGDLPIFVDQGSADVAERPELFRLDRRGRPEVVTGVPPDCFSKDGQRWGHPHYRWAAHKKTDFRWWVERTRASLERFDALRIDHFIGFHHAYEIPARAKTARRGAWRKQDGAALLATLARHLKSLPFVAEDLGAVTQEVVALRDRFRLPGMAVIQHSLGDDASASRVRRGSVASVAYTGTHDNDTTLGWWRHSDAATRARVRSIVGVSAARDPARALSELTLATRAVLAVLPMQDLLSLGSEARMNLPGSTRGNWEWRLPRGWRRLSRANTAAISRLVEHSGRDH